VQSRQSTAVPSDRPGSWRRFSRRHCFRANDPTVQGDPGGRECGQGPVHGSLLRRPSHCCWNRGTQTGPCRRSALPVSLAGTRPSRSALLSRPSPRPPAVEVARDVFAAACTARADALPPRNRRCRRPLLPHCSPSLSKLRWPASLRVCGGSVTVVGRRQKASVEYSRLGCTTHSSRGLSICSNALAAPDAARHVVGPAAPTCASASCCRRGH
jgi:hypothetical protein